MNMYPTPPQIPVPALNPAMHTTISPIGNVANTTPVIASNPITNTALTPDQTKFMPEYLENVHKHTTDLVNGINYGAAITNGLGHTVKSLGLVRDPPPPQVVVHHKPTTNQPLVFPTTHSH